MIERRPDEVIAALTGRRFSLAREKETQGEIAHALEQARIPFQREVTLVPGSVIDFLCEQVGLEVKIGGSKRAIHRQCERYCKTGKISALILATNVATGFPPQINAVPCFVVSLGKAWL